MHTLDDTDRRILRALQDEPGLSTAALAEKAGLSPSPCWRRVERMEAAGVIEGRVVEIDLRKLGYEVQVFLRVRLDKTQAGAFQEFIAAAREVPEIVVIQTLLGRVDIRMDVVARDLAHYQEILRNRILDLPHVADIDALLLVSELKDDEWLPI
ncbi:Lrp/AsnC family transcriptional regulator [Pikeienuella piscinae]|uniref:Lrp/AsnC family transcriptional regulator n=1 Tax=Pikeienuella piscinae TaxID=2748098 RepID=A0A7L5BTV9_9RHOB|nr:Lrp/AsnC family transcriptional regulator [Pikeienuella piscinae]QIE54952.1 Lrp/AsnC family transcriptional regulator [Pikeienuella piscinae]